MVPLVLFNPMFGYLYMWCVATVGHFSLLSNILWPTYVTLSYPACPEGHLIRSGLGSADSSANAPRAAGG